MIKVDLDKLIRAPKEQALPNISFHQQQFKSQGFKHYVNNVNIKLPKKYICISEMS